MAGTAPAPAAYFTREGGSLVVCSLCPKKCRIKPGSAGACRVRRNDGGELVLPYYGLASALSVDPIEKKPLYHFLPGSSSFSIGYVGCNLHCPFCQNYHISQSVEAALERIDPAGLADRARRAGCQSIAHTYSEPVVHAEFVVEAMRAARASGLLNVLVTNGCAGPDAAGALLSLCDAVNVDIKSWDPAFYRDELGGDLDSVRAFVEMAHSSGVHVEATTLVIPGKTDDPAQIAGISAFLASVSQDIPLHLSAYHPMYRYSIAATPASTIRLLAEKARRNLRYVYPGNLPGERAITQCQSCGALLVSRRGYAVDSSGLRGGACAACSAASPIVSAQKKNF